MIVDGADVYARPPRIEGLTVPGGKQWVALDLEALADVAAIAGVELLVVDEHTTMRDVTRELRANAAYYRLAQGL